jgi:mRNA-degrading endonuclease RelE of RelBE toxin-antitoxin system
MRIGNYRVVYKVLNGEIIIIDVLQAGSRGDIYKKL